MATLATVPRVTWDVQKELKNIRKHGIDFTEAASVVLGGLARSWPDDGHSVDEARHVTIGYSDQQRLLMVMTQDIGDHTVRIISARRATKRERHDYEAR